ncbi:MAG: hypothetical protein IIB05_11945, partial [Bacteroidetes bacterium]|nr:hypothetical protein [Bacteroidota bacterium]
ITQLKQGATLIRQDPLDRTGQALTSHPCTVVPHYRAGARQALFQYSTILPI